MSSENQTRWELENPLLKDPLYRAKDLGKALPGGPYSTAVCLPTWTDNVELKTGDERVIGALELSYPRNRMHPFVRQLHEVLKKENDIPENDAAVAFQSIKHAENAAAYFRRELPNAITSLKLLANGLSLLSVRDGQNDFAVPMAIQQYLHDTGHILSARQAEDLLSGFGSRPALKAKQQIHETLDNAMGAKPPARFLYPNAMEGMYQLYQVLLQRSGGKKTAQVGSPYVSTLNLQKSFGSGVHIFKKGNDEEIQQIKYLAQSRHLSAVFTEVPSNPLLKTVDLEKLAAALRPYRVPLVIDDTLAPPFNVNVAPYADVIVTSLTKSFSGYGDAMGGSVCISPESLLKDELTERLKAVYEDHLYGRDAEALAHGSRDWGARVEQMDQNAEAVYDLMQSKLHPSRIFYPQRTTRQAYDIVKRSRGGFGNIISYVFERQAQAKQFFDALKLTKGISLGTNFTLNSLYVILAHDHERHVMLEMGLTRHLIRSSIGLEETGELVGKFEKALEKVKA